MGNVDGVELHTDLDMSDITVIGLLPEMVFCFQDGGNSKRVSASSS